MTNIERELKNLNTIRLPEEARTRMRAELSAYADLHAMAVPPAASQKALPVARLFQTFRFRMYASAVAVLAIVVGLGGTAYASSDALPGDTLYAVKTAFAEPVQTALVPDTEGKASWHAVLAERRLEEAAQLAAQNRLSSETQEQLAESFTTHVAASLHDADLLEKSGRTDRSLAVRSDLEARLEAHTHILGVIAAHYASAASSSSSLATARSLGDLLSAVQEKESAVSATRLALESDIAPQHEPAASAAVSVSAGDTGSTVQVAIADHASETSAGSAVQVSGFAPMAARVAPAAKMAAEPSAEVSAYDAARATEVKKIIDLHAELLSAFLPPASTTATSTEASTTEATSSPQSSASADDEEDAGIEIQIESGAKAAADAADTLKDTLKGILD